MQNQFLGFANQIIAQHTQTGGPFDSAAMIFPEPEEQTDGETVRNSYVTNLYRMQNLTQENYLYQNQLHFVTQILEKQSTKDITWEATGKYTASILLHAIEKALDRAEGSVFSE